ncbi:MAG: AAA family ATPase [Caulobacteraceae bacterium]|nr:AAA family ATPase [Caulobacteraceae bacterium]
MKLRRIRISGYKALADVTIDIPRDLLILIGVNGAGKSSILQALSFVRYFAAGTPGQFFNDRHWFPRQVRSQFSRSASIRFDLAFDTGTGEILWQFTWSLASGTSQKESVWYWDRKKIGPELVLTYRDHSLSSPESDEVNFTGLKLPGSMLSIIDLKRLDRGSDALVPLKEWSEGINSLELLSPSAMRQGDRGSPVNIGNRGERLSGFLASLDATQKGQIVERLAPFYPLRDINTTRKRAGWVDMRISERYDMGDVSTAHISDGFLRLLALAAIPEFQDKTGMVLLDEVEDGIEPHILPDIIKSVSHDSRMQLVMTSHSPLLVNFFETDEVTLVARNTEGSTITAPLSELPTVKAGREYFGGGEIWAMMDAETIKKEALRSHDTEVPPNSELDTSTGARRFLRQGALAQ